MNSYPYSDPSNNAVPSLEDILLVKEAWKVGEGDYSREKVEYNNELVSIEEIITREVAILLNERIATNDKSPVVIMDFGSGLGFSMVRIAKKYKNEINTNKLVICATNLTYLPNPNTDRHITDPEGIIIYNKILSSYGVDYYKHAQLVKWIRGDIYEVVNFLARNKLKVYMLHEYYVFMHIKNLDLDSTSKTSEDRIMQLLTPRLAKKATLITHNNSIHKFLDKPTKALPLINPESDGISRYIIRL